jgi:nucleotide-binding universal stress UspA family protein
MFDRLVVALDRSSGSETILSLSAALARRCRAGIIVVPLEDIVPTQVVAEFAAKTGPAGAWLPSGPVMEAQSSCQELGSVLIVALNDTPRRRVRSLDDPVLLLPAQPTTNLIGGQRHSPRFLVVLTHPGADGVDLQSVTMLAQSVDAHLTLVTVVSPADPDLAPAPARGGRANHGVRVRVAQLQLDRLADQLREEGVSVASIVLTSRDPTSGLIEKLRQGYDLVAVGCPSSTDDRDLGPELESVIAQTEKPVLLMRTTIANPGGQVMS